jgi:hypothetical protein
MKINLLADRKPSECWEVDSIGGWTLKVLGVELGVTYPYYRHIPHYQHIPGGEWCWRWRTSTEEGIANDKESAMLAVEERMRERAKAILMATGGL